MAGSWLLNDTNRQKREARPISVQREAEEKEAQDPKILLSCLSGTLPGTGMGGGTDGLML
jgi:hypothetical protein